MTYNVFSGTLNPTQSINHNFLTDAAHTQMEQAKYNPTELMYYHNRDSTSL